MSQNVGEYIAALLEQEGLDKMFILTGGDHFLWIALDDRGCTGQGRAGGEPERQEVTASQRTG